MLNWDLYYERNVVPFCRLLYVQIASAGIAGFAETTIMHPLDLVKTRMQIRSSAFENAKDPNKCRFIIQCLFFTFEVTKPHLLFGHAEPVPLTYTCAGFLSGVSDAFVSNPFEVIKVTLQANYGKSKEMPSLAEVAKGIYKKSGLRGFQIGFPATMMRNSCWNAIFLGNYYISQDLYKQYYNKCPCVYERMAIGSSSGLYAAIITIPFDVAKSRIQAPQEIFGKVKYKYTIRTIITIYREEGFLALYKGLTPKILRVAPGGAIMLTTYDYLHSYFGSIVHSGDNSCK